MRSKFFLVAALLLALASTKTAHAQFKLPKVSAPKIDIKVPAPKIDVQLPAPKLPDLPKIPAPKLPDLPSIPTPKLPDLPKIPTPKLPELPKIPTPKLPNLPTGQELADRLSIDLPTDKELADRLSIDLPTDRELADRLSIDLPSAEDLEKRLPTLAALGIDPILAVAVELYQQQQVAAAKAKIAEARKQLAAARAELEQKSNELFADLNAARNGVRKSVAEEHPLHAFWRQMKLLDNPREAFKANEEIKSATEEIRRQIRKQASDKLKAAEDQRIRTLEASHKKGLADLNTACEQALDGMEQQRAEREQQARMMALPEDTYNKYIAELNSGFEKAKEAVKSDFAAQAAEFSRQVESTKKALAEEFAKIRSDSSSAWSTEVSSLESQHVDAYLKEVAEKQRTLFIDQTTKYIKSCVDEQNEKLDEEERKIDEAAKKLS